MANSTFSFATISGRLRQSLGVFLAGGLWSIASLSQAACPTESVPACTESVPACDGSTAQQAYEIGSVEELYWLTQSGESLINDTSGFAYIKQTADIDAASIDDCASGDQWQSPQLVGSYDGGGFTIKNLTAYLGKDINGNAQGFGLFGALQKSNTVTAVTTVKNLTLDTFAVDENADRPIGAIAGAVGTFGGEFKISNVKVESSTIKVGNTSPGGMGGVIGSISSAVDKATLSGVVVKDSTLKSLSTSESRIGGLIGRTFVFDNFDVTDSYFIGDIVVNRKRKVGGIFGEFDITGSEPSGEIKNIYVVIRDGSGADPGLEAFGTINNGNAVPDPNNLTVSGLYQETPGSLPDPNPETLATGIQVEKFRSADLTDETTFFKTDVSGNRVSGFDFTASGPWRTNSLINDGAPYLSWEFSDPEVTIDTSGAPTSAGLAADKSSPQTVTLGQSLTLNISVNSGFSVQIDSSSTCDGTLTGTTYQTDPLTEDCTVSITASQAPAPSSGGSSGGSGGGTPDAGSSQTDSSSEPQPVPMGSLVVWLGLIVLMLIAGHRRNPKGSGL